MTHNMQIAATIEFLKTDLSGGIYSDETTNIFEAELVETDVEAQGILFSELGGVIAEAVGIEGTLDLPDQLESIADEYSAHLNQAYLKVINTGESTEYEYALSINVVIDEEGLDKLKTAVPFFEMLAIKALSINVWNTEQEALLDKMNIVNLDDFENISGNETPVVT